MRQADRRVAEVTRGHCLTRVVQQFLKSCALRHKVALQGARADHHVLGNLTNRDLAIGKPAAQQLLHVRGQLLQRHAGQLIDVLLDQLLTPDVRRFQRYR
ncbi:hypothetical protein D3C76_936670 [compost metagenome]